MAKKKPIITNAMRMLDKAKIKYEAHEYEYDGDIPDNFGMLISEKTGIAPEMSFKTLVLKGEKNGICVACIPINKEIDLKKFAKNASEKKFEMIHVKELLNLTGYIRGGVSPLGMKKTYPTFFDASAEKLEKIAVSAGICGCTLVLSAADLLKITEAKTIDIIKEN